MLDDVFCTINGFKVRPKADNGLWVLFLLPLSLIISSLRHPVVLTPTYKLSSLLSIGLILTSIVIVFHKREDQKLKIINKWNMLILLLTILFHIFLEKGLIFSIASGILSTVVYIRTYVFILKNFKNCFTLGEAGIVSQSLIILLYCTSINILNSIHTIYGSHMQISTLIIQIRLLGIGIIASVAYFFHLRRTSSFYLLTCFVIIFVIILPLQILLNRNPLLWILNLVLTDLSTLKLVIYWSFCSGTAVLAVSNQIVYAKKASTGMRKIFHLLAVAVYIPGLLYRCSFLYLASGVMLGIFFLLEILRILNIPPLGRHLQDGFVVFSDEKDIGTLALTPIYLLVGCSLPIWIHPSPCDVTDSAMFNLLPLLSGLLSIGVGDTAASIIGSNYGKHFWPGSKKTVEGTVACILAQIGLVRLLMYFDALEYLSFGQNIRLYLAILVGSIVEARTTQIDNLVLPLLMYIILI
ncbi:dolichol kinase [Anoplophora glabripennis]|nr:dolichol kinase [Anoplophora glabripennis]